MISRGSVWCTEAVLIALVVLAPWAFGAVRPPFELWVAYGLAAVLVFWAVRVAVDGRVIWFQGTCSGVVATGLYGLFFLALLQTFVLPSSVLSALSPGVPRTLDELLPEQREQILGASEPVTKLPTLSAGNRLSLNPGGSYQFSVRLLALVALFVAVGSLPSTRSTLFKISIAAAVVGTALALYGIVQAFSSEPDQIYWYFQTSGRGFGPFINRNHYPFYANLALGLTVGLLLDRYEQTGRRWFGLFTRDSYAVWLLAAIAFMMASVVFCLSRGGFVALVLASIVCVLARYQKGRMNGTFIGFILLVASASIVLTWVGFDLFTSRLNMLAESDKMREEGRLYLWLSALTNAAQFPLFGSGGETYRYWETILNQSEVWNSANAFAYRADNEFLDVLSEYGIGGFLMLVTVAGGTLFHGFHLARHDGLAAGAFMGLTAVIAHSFFDFGLRLPASAVFATVVAALLCGLHKASAKNFDARATASKDHTLPFKEEHISAFGRVGAIGVALACLVLALFFVQEKRRIDVADRLQVLGLRAFQAGDFNRCVDYLSRSAHTVPEDVQRQIDTARIVMLAASVTEVEKLKNERIAIALTHCVWARDLCPLAWEPYLWLAQHVEHLERGDTRLAYLEKAHRLHPSSSDIAFALGALLYDEARYAEAWPHWRESLRFSSAHLDAIISRTRGHLTPEECIELILPADAEKVYDAATRAENAGHSAESLAFFSRVIALLEERKLPAKPQERAAGSEFAARVYQKLGQQDKAIDAYRDAIVHRPDAAQWRLTLAQLLVTQERFDEAFREVRTFLVFEPDNKAALAFLDRVVRLQDENQKSNKVEAPIPK